FLAASDGVGSGGQHGVNGIEAIAPQSVLRAIAVKIQRQRENLSLANQRGRIENFFWRDIIERANLIFRAPASPIFQLLGSSIDIFQGYFRIVLGHSSHTPEL